MRYDNPTPGDPNHPDAAFHRSYSYDPIGNRISSTEGTDPAVYYCANELNQYETLDAAATCPPTTPDESFTHDADGNLTQDNDFAYTWDAENRLIRVEPAGSPVNGDKKLEFVYDYMGRRIEKKVSTHNGSSWSAPAATRFVYYNWLCLVEYDVDGGGDLDTSKKYTWGLDLAGLNGGAGESTPIEGAAGIGGLLATRDVGQSKNYVHFYDGNGNVVQLIDRSDGSVDAAYEYDAYGNSIAQSGVYADENAYRFSTRVVDPEIGMSAYPYRIYDSKVGRWLSRDPIGEKGARNLYVYASNSPSKLVDPLGLCDYPPLPISQLEVARQPGAKWTRQECDLSNPWLYWLCVDEDDKHVWVNPTSKWGETVRNLTTTRAFELDVIDAISHSLRRNCSGDCCREDDGYTLIFFSGSVGSRTTLGSDDIEDFGNVGGLHMSYNARCNFCRCCGICLTACQINYHVFDYFHLPVGHNYFWHVEYEKQRLFATGCRE